MTMNVYILGKKSTKSFPKEFLDTVQIVFYVEMLWLVLTYFEMY